MNPLAPQTPPSPELAASASPNAGAAAIAPASDSAADQGAALSPTERARVEKAAVKFEAMFIGEMLKQMRRTTREFAGDDSVYKDRIAGDMLDMADTAVADSLAGQRAFGIADAILKQLIPAVPAPKR